MQTAPVSPSPAGPPPRASFPDASRTLVAADARTRELAQAMVRLNAEGECTEAALLREGFSKFELEHLAPAARGIADGISSASCVPATSWCWTTSRPTRPRASGR